MSATLDVISRDRHERSVRRRRAFKEMYSGELRELWRLRGHDADAKHVRQAVDRGIAPIGGGAPGKGAAAFYLNTPAAGSYVSNVDYFNQETERNDVPQQPFAYSGLGGGRMDNRITNVGILANVRLIFQGTLTIAGTVTSTYQWPWNLAKSITLSANGQTTLQQAQGLDFRARRNRIFRNPIESLCAAPATDANCNPNPGTIAPGAYAIQLIFDMSIVHDMTTLTGALFAQSDSNYLAYSIQPAQVADLFTVASGGSATLTGEFYPELTYFDIPYVDTQQGRQVIVPDLQWLHGFIASNNPFANTGDVATPLIKNAGQLIALYLYADNGGVAQINPATGMDQFRLEYGGNRVPILWSGPPSAGPVFGLEDNERDYDGVIKPGYLILDLENDNPDRDLIYPRGVSELQAVCRINAGITVNANAHVHFVEETLFSGQ